MKRFFAMLLAALLLMTAAACDTQEATEAPEAPAGNTWSVYWYLCGSDLESGGGFASGDLAELTSVQLPEGVTFVIETGGASAWENEDIDPSVLQRFVYDKDGLRKVDEQPSASMGETATLQDFLSYAKTNYPAEKTAVLFWNHGGGSVAGAAFDELYNSDSLTLDEMHSAFDAVWELSAEKPPLELIGFDTCLMATVDVASTFSDIGKYMVASEETEPANGWYYSGWAGALAKDTSLDGAALGKIICDTYMEGCEAVGTQDNTTLSVTDLSKIPALVEQYNAFGADALSAACSDPGFYSSFARIAVATENYGGNTRDQGYTNMADLGHLSGQLAASLPAAKKVQDALADCIVYRVNGQYRAQSNGLSCYYSYNADAEDFAGFQKQGISDAFKYFYEYGLTGTLSDDGMKFLSQLSINSLPERDTTSVNDWNGVTLDVDDDGYAVLSLGGEAQNVLARIGFSLYLADENGTYLLGTDNDMTADWDNGVFKDNFRGVWGALDGNVVYMSLYYDGDDYNLYSIPILLNGAEYNLMVVYDFTTEQWSIQGARKPINESGMADKELRELTNGDVITIIQYVADESGETTAYSSAEVTVTDGLTFGETKLGDGQYVMVFEMTDAQGNTAQSAAVTFTCENGEITTSVE